MYIHGVESWCLKPCRHRLEPAQAYAVQSVTFAKQAQQHHKLIEYTVGTDDAEHHPVYFA